MSKLDDILLTLKYEVDNGVDLTAEPPEIEAKAEIKALFLEIAEGVAAIDDEDGEIWANLDAIVKKVEAL